MSNACYLISVCGLIDQWAYNPVSHPSSGNGLSEKQDVFLFGREDNRSWIIESPPLYLALPNFLYTLLWFLHLSVLANLEG